MLVTRSFLFSFSILWRLCLVAPFLIIFLAVFGLIGSILLSIVSLISPLLGTLIVVAAGFAISSSFPIILGARLGFQAKHEKAYHGYGRMFMFSMIYGFCEALAVIVVGGIFGAIISVAAISGVAETMPWQIWLILASALFVLVAGVRSLMLVPMAGAALGRDANGQRHTPFFDAGAGGRALWIVSVVTMLVGLIVMVAIVFLVIPIDAMMNGGFQEAVGPFGRSNIEFTWQMILFACVAFVLSQWTLSWQAAAGVLVYLAKRDEQTEDHVVHSDEDRAAARDLWRQRMPPGRR